ncbi:BamA/TamA family outer membrane protein, partial [bacterium]|nr:BamA/TamA family outer membrane protein [bacterium]
YLLHMADQTIEPITATPALEKDPVFAPDGKRIAYTSDACGVSNIYVRQLADSVCYPITNALTGIYHLSWATDKMAFASFHNAGYDVYILERPDSIKAGDIMLQPTQFMRSLAAADSALKQMPPVIVQTENLDIKMETVIPDSIPPLTPLALAEMSDKNSDPPRRKENKLVVALDSTVYLTADGQYRSKPYKTKFTPDMVYSSASYEQIFGIRAISQFSFSDITGNQQIHLLFNIQEDLRNSSYMLYYMNSKNRLNYGAGAYNYTYYIPGTIDWAKDRNYGATAYLQYPFSKYSRLDYSTQFRAIDRDWVTYPLPEEKRRVFINTLGYIRDTAVWGYTGPKNGGRSAITLNYSPPFFDTSLDFFTLEGDFRKYLRISREHSFAIRLTGGASFGDEPQRFFLGGVDNWVNQYFQQGIRIDDLNDVYFSSFVAPMRAGDYFEQVGTRYLLTNLEWRFPLIHYLALGWPLPMGFQNIRGSLFTDIGSAWENDKTFHPFTTTAKGWPKLDDMLAAWGMGIRMNMGYFLFRLDISWKTDLTRSGSQHKPRYYFSFGIDY